MKVRLAAGNRIAHVKNDDGSPVGIARSLRDGDWGFRFSNNMNAAEMLGSYMRTANVWRTVYPRICRVIDDSALGEIA